MKITNLIAIMTAGFIFASSAVFASAAPRFTWTPTNGNYSVGQEFTVDLAVDSDTEKVVGIDVVGTFDKDKIEIVSIEKITTADPAFQFNWDANTAKINNVTGTYSASLVPMSSSVLDGVISKQSLLKFKFKAKATGIAALNLTCLQGSVNDTNILNPSSVDVDTCSLNQAGSYTIDISTASTVTPTLAVAQAVPTSATLPETGSLGATIGLVVFGSICVLGALFLGLL